MENNDIITTNTEEIVETAEDIVKTDFNGKGKGLVGVAVGVAAGILICNIPRAITWIKNRKNRDYGIDADIYDTEDVVDVSDTESSDK